LILDLLAFIHVVILRMSSEMDSHTQYDQEQSPHKIEIRI